MRPRIFGQGAEVFVGRSAGDFATGAHDVTLTRLAVTFRDSYPPGFNDPALTARATSALAALLGKRNVVARPHPIMFSDDFVYYQKKAPGVYLHLGVRPPSTRSMTGIHSATFLPDEKALMTAMTVHAGLALAILGINQQK